jgi:hypothetical protein
LATCRFFATIVNADTSPCAGERFFVTVKGGLVGGIFIHPDNPTFVTDRAGKVSFSIVQGASITITGTHPRFKSPITLTVPSQSTCDLMELI